MRISIDTYLSIFVNQRHLSTLMIYTGHGKSFAIHRLLPTIPYYIQSAADTQTRYSRVTSIC